MCPAWPVKVMGQINRLRKWEPLVSAFAGGQQLLSPGLQDDIATIHPWSRPWSRQRSSELLLLLTCLRDNWEIFAVVLPVEQLEAAPRHRPLMLLKLQTVSRRLLLSWPHDQDLET